MHAIGTNAILCSSRFGYWLDKEIHNKEAVK